MCNNNNNNNNNNNKTYREIEYSSRNMMVYFKRLRSSGFVSLEAFKTYYVMHTFAPSLHRKSTDFLIYINISAPVVRLGGLAPARPITD